MHSTSFSLLQRLQQRRDSADWAKFVSIYSPILFLTARRLGLQEADAADLAQDVLVYLFERLPEFRLDREGSFRNWLFVVMRNKWRDRLRKHHAQPLPNEEIQHILDAQEFRELEERDYRRILLQETMKTLRPEFSDLMWQAFQGYAIEGRDINEVCESLGVKPGTIYAAKSRILLRLRQELSGMFEA